MDGTIKISCFLSQTVVGNGQKCVCVCVWVCVRERERERKSLKRCFSELEVKERFERHVLLQRLMTFAQMDVMKKELGKRRPSDCACQIEAGTEENSTREDRTWRLTRCAEDEKKD